VSDASLTTSVGLVGRADFMPAPSSSAPHRYEAIVIGGGMCGIYQLYRLRDLGVDVLLLEAGEDVGGTWYWNRYPGARFDSESYTYAYSFSEELREEWDWTELFAGQSEVRRYISYVADKFRLRENIRFCSTVTSARYVESDHSWVLQLADGKVFTTRFILTSVGVLSVPSMPELPGIQSFRGDWFHSARWPEELELAGKRVAVVGTGSSGVQIISEIVGDVRELFVFQRHPSWGAPLHNRPIDAEEMSRIKENYQQIFDRCRLTPGGFIHMPDRRRLSEVSDEERVAFWEELYAQPGFGILLANFLDVATSESANVLLSEFAAQKIRQRVHDPILAEKLIPKDHGFGTRRLVLETNYYEVYNRDNVHLVDLLETPIDHITGTSVVTSDREYEVDVIVLATGFDAVTGSFDQIDFTGVKGQKLRDKWAGGPITYLGVQTHGFPNLLFLSGPQAGSGAANLPRGIEDGVNWATDLIKYLRERGCTRIEAQREAEERWVEHVAERLSKTLIGRTKSWFTGYNSNIADRDQPRLLLYMGGNILYRRILADVAAAGFEGFDLQSAPGETQDEERAVEAAAGGA
jgi:cation diffusion facilitator CzcD-associated flavoprotein CzcO